jgi:hypothetical protein
MYDVIRDTISNLLIPKPSRPSFRHDILPLLSQCVEAQWVNAGFLALFGWQSPNDFLRRDYLQKLAAAPGETDPYKELRRQVYYSFRDPGGSGFEPLQWPPLYGDAFGSFDNPPGPREGFAVTATLYRFLGQWASGVFIADYDDTEELPRSLDEVKDSDRPATLDRAALHFCMGGPFHPGCEMTWPMRRSSMYRAPFRLRERAAENPHIDYGDYMTPVIALAFDGPLSASGPGDVTKWMAVPWQSDTDSCRAGYPVTPFPADEFIPTFWPSRVPNHVLTAENYRIAIDPKQPLDARMRAFHTRDNWLRNLDFNAPKAVQLDAMVHRFGSQGVIERYEHDAGPEFPGVMYVETLPPKLEAAARSLQVGGRERGHNEVSEEYSIARFPRLRR